MKLLLHENPNKRCQGLEKKMKQFEEKLLEKLKNCGTLGKKNCKGTREVLEAKAHTQCQMVN